MIPGTRNWLLVFCILALPGYCAAAGPAGSGPDRFSVFVSILPQKTFVERVGGPHVQVHVLVPPGQAPETYEPTPRQMAALGSARVFFRAGLPFEEPLFRRGGGAFGSVEVVDTRTGVPLRAFHHHGHGHGAADAGHPDPHVWLDPERVKIQAGTICETLCRVDPVHADAYREGLNRFHRDLDRVHVRVSTVLAPLKGRKIYVFHPAFGYFTDAYGLVQVPLEEEGKEPGPRRLAGLIEQARQDRVRVLFVQPQHSAQEARAFADAVGARIVPLDPLAGDYLANLERMADAVRGAFDAP